MPHLPKIPPEQRSFAAPGARSGDDALSIDPRDLALGLQPAHADVNTGAQGRFGNLSQNLTTRWVVQGR